MGWEHRRKYSDEQREWIKDLWQAGKSSQEIADAYLAHFQTPVTRNIIIGIVQRLKLPPRPDSGPWRMAGARRREANAQLKAETALAALVGASVQKLNNPTPEPAPDLTLRAPIGPVGGFPEAGGCKWPVSESPFQCCGQPVQGRKSYCPAHAAIGRAAQQPKPPKAGPISGARF